MRYIINLVAAMVSPKMDSFENALNQLDLARPPKGKKETSGSESHLPEQLAAASEGQYPQREPSFSMAVQPFPAQQHGERRPTLPKLKSPSISNHRHGANPALAMNLLHEIETIVANWQQELQTIVRQIQDLYLEGPIVDGWLDSHDRKVEEGQQQVRQANADRLRDYVEESFNQPNAKVTYQSPRTGYRLCGLDANGQYWSEPCPPDQVASVSLAIARHQKLKQLLSRKQDLETRLCQLAETLVVMHSHLSKN